VALQGCLGTKILIYQLDYRHQPHFVEFCRGWDETFENAASFKGHLIYDVFPHS